MLITHKRLLEWNPSGDSDRDSRTDFVGSYRTMWIAPFMAAGRGDHARGVKAGRVGRAGPILGLWFTAPRSPGGSVGRSLAAEKG